MPGFQVVHHQLDGLLLDQYFGVTRLLGSDHFVLLRVEYLDLVDVLEDDSNQVAAQMTHLGHLSLERRH